MKSYKTNLTQVGLPLQVESKAVIRFIQVFQPKRKRGSPIIYNPSLAKMMTRMMRRYLSISSPRLLRLLCSFFVPLFFFPFSSSFHSFLVPSITTFHSLKVKGESSRIKISSQAQPTAPLFLLVMQTDECPFGSSYIWAQPSTYLYRHLSTRIKALYIQEIILCRWVGGSSSISTSRQQQLQSFYVLLSLCFMSWSQIKDLLIIMLIEWSNRSCH